MIRNSEKKLYENLFRWADQNHIGNVLIPRDIEAILFYVNFLDLAKKDLHYIPEGIGLIDRLEWLFLDENNLTNIPIEILHLQHLEWLSLDKNQLSEINFAICNMKSLTSLFLSDNKITYIPPFIRNLQSLDTLSLSGNQINELPSELFELSNLESLFLDNNQITELPKEIKNLKKLKVLSLVNNLINELPDELFDIEAFHQLLKHFSKEYIYNNLEILGWSNKAVFSEISFKKEDKPLDILLNYQDQLIVDQYVELRKYDKTSIINPIPHMVLFRKLNPNNVLLILNQSEFILAKLTFTQSSAYLDFLNFLIEN